MEQEAGRAPRQGLRVVFASLRMQIMLLLLTCYLIPALTLSVFIQTKLIPSLREKTVSALTTDAEHAWTLARQNIDLAIDLAREAIYDGELASVYESWAGGGLADAEYLRLSRSYIDRKYSRSSQFTFAGYFPVDAPELYMYTRSGYNEAVRFLEEGQRQALALGQALDTRTGILEVGDRLYLVRNLLNLRMERYGMLVLGLNREELLSPLLQLGESWQGRVFIRLDDTGDTGVHWEAYPAGITEKGQEIRFARQAEGDDYSLRLLLILSRRQQYREIYAFQYLALGLYLLLIPVLAFLAWYVGRRIVKPITLLSSASRRIERGEWGVTVPMRGGDELGNLGVAFSNMSLRIKQLIDKTYKEELALKDAQIQALQSRINPHFINNALEAINWQARIEKSETIPGMVSALSVLLGASMARQDRRLVPLREEMKVADAYIYFIQQRFDHHDDPRCTITALECRVVNKRLLNRVQLSGFRILQSFQRDDSLSFTLHCENGAAGDSISVDDDGAGSTDSLITAQLCRCQFQPFPQRMHQRFGRRNILRVLSHSKLVVSAVYIQHENLFLFRFHMPISFLLFPDWGLLK